MRMFFDYFRKKRGASPEDVRDFYNKHNTSFLKVYGEIIQAFRTTEVSKLLDYQIEAIGLKPKQKVLDAGCGVAGPASYFANKIDLSIDALTISDVQYKEGLKNIEKKGLSQNVSLHLGDYHKLNEYFKEEYFDRIYFLESFGHSNNKKKVLESAWNVLKPGGQVYIKDLFRKIAVFLEHQKRIDKEIEKINKAYRYHIANLYEVLKNAQQLGFVLSAVKTIDLKVEEFENLTISNEFQELTGIAKIENWEDYIFPVDFFEIKLYKPVHKLEEGLDKYFLQNVYYMQVKKRKQEDL